MKLPILISSPHAGTEIPPEVEDICLLSNNDIIADGDEQAIEIYDFQDKVSTFLSTNIARAFVDLNRASDDRRIDGVVKTHTCLGVPIYSEPLSEELIKELLFKYYWPYHNKLSEFASTVKVGIDCHTMRTVGPPVGPDPDKPRPLICLSNADGTCPDNWFFSLAVELERVFQTAVSLNKPFTGGYIIRSHANELPWIQLEFSRTGSLTVEEKRIGVLQALDNWSQEMLE